MAKGRRGSVFVRFRQMEKKLTGHKREGGREGGGEEPRHFKLGSTLRNLGKSPCWGGGVEEEKKHSRKCLFSTKKTLTRWRSNSGGKKFANFWKRYGKGRVIVEGGGGWVSPRDHRDIPWTTP